MLIDLIQYLSKKKMKNILSIVFYCVVFQGFSQNYLARISGVALEEIVSIEKQGAMPTINDLYKLQDILGGGIVVSGDTIARL